MAIGIIATLLATPQYTASSIIEIQRETSNITQVPGSEQKTDYVDQEFYQTQYGLLRSKALSERIATNLRLYDNEHFFTMFGAGKGWFNNGRPREAVANRDVRVRTAGAILLAHFQINSERLSRLVELKFTSPDPGLSQQIVNEWATGFIRVNLERRFGATAYARQFLERRIAQLRNRIDESERKLVDYASKEGIVNLPGQNTGPGGTEVGERSLVAENLASLNRELTDATADRVKAQSRLRVPDGEATEALNNTAIGNLRQKRAELAADYAKLMVQFEPGYPPAKALRTQIDQIDRSIAREEQRVKSSIAETYSASVGREQDLQNRVTSLKSGVLDYRRRSIQYDIYQRDVDTNRELYNALLQRYKEIGVAGGVGVNNISIVDAAEYPTSPSSPRLIINLIVTFLAGAVIGLGGVILAEQLDQGIKDPAEVEDELGLPLLGTIPRLADGDILGAVKDRKSSIAEAYLSLQTSLSFTTAHGLPRTLAVTSTRPAEGKTTTSFALAQSFARSAHKILLLDADMRSPSVHRMFDSTNSAGLSNFLSGDDNLSSFVHRVGETNLFYMTAGQQPPSAPELLSSDRFSLLLKRLSEMFDHIVIDAPPVMGLADASLIGNQVEGLVFVIESHATHKNTANVALGRLRSADVPILGVVLTKFNPRRGHFNYGYDYSYGYSYGHDTERS